MANVVATQRGFYGRQLREAGDRFEVRDGETASWWKPVEAPLFGDTGDHESDGASAVTGTSKRGRKPRMETVEAPSADPFGDAPAPVYVENSFNAATGATQPDWMNPGGDI